LGQTLDLSWAALSLAPAGVPPSRYYWGDCPGDLVSGDPPPLDANANGDCHQRNTGEASCVVPLVANGAANGSLLVGPKRHDLELLPEDRLLISTLVPLLVTALEKASLVDRLEQHVADLEERKHALAALSGRLLRVQEEERRRLALELHDDPLQRAILLARQLERDPNDAQFRQWRQEVEEIVAALRATCMGLRPPTLDDLGLAGGLEWLTSSVSARSDLAVSLTEETDDGAPFPWLDPDLEGALYRVAQEALNNCLKHAEASQVAVRLRRRDREIQLWVTDDGRGIPSSFDGQRQSIHLGILGMQEQLRPWGGTVTVEPGPVGGTIVRAQVALGGNHGGAE